MPDSFAALSATSAVRFISATSRYYAKSQESQECLGYCRQQDSRTRPGCNTTFCIKPGTAEAVQFSLVVCLLGGSHPRFLNALSQQEDGLTNLGVQFMKTRSVLGLEVLYSWDLGLRVHLVRP